MHFVVRLYKATGSVLYFITVECKVLIFLILLRALKGIGTVVSITVIAVNTSETLWSLSVEDSHSWHLSECLED